MKINEYKFDHDILVASNQCSFCNGKFHMSGWKKYFATVGSSPCLNASRNRWIRALKYPGGAKSLKWFKKLNAWFKKQQKKFN